MGGFFFVGVIMQFRNRLQYFLVQNLGISNQEAKQLISGNKLSCNGIIITENIIVGETDEIKLEDTILQPAKTFHYIALHKPRGIETTLNPDISNNLRSIFRFPDYVFPVGRLDKESEGLLLMTNDGKLANKLMVPEFQHEKEYYVEINSPLTQNFIEKVEQGFFLNGRKTKPAVIKRAGDQSFFITLTEGMNRQIRRICAVFDYEVNCLRRIRISGVSLGALPPGAFRTLSEQEINELHQSLSPSDTA